MSKTKKPPRYVWVVCGPGGYPWSVHHRRGEAGLGLPQHMHAVHRYRLDEPKKKGARK